MFAPAFTFVLCWPEIVKHNSGVSSRNMIQYRPVCDSMPNHKVIKANGDVELQADVF